MRALQQNASTLAGTCTLKEENIALPRIGVVLILIALAGCQHAAAAPSTSPTQAGESGTGVRGPFRVPVRMADVSEFRPAVPAVDEGGHCESVPPAPMLQPGQRGLLYSFGPREARRRNVMVIVDSADLPVRYSDIRGDLRGPNDASLSVANPMGPRTTIAINFRDTTGMLRNIDTDADSGALRVRGPAILTALNLGAPARMTARVIKECAGRRG
jgi:hypothetical protein